MFMLRDEHATQVVCTEWCATLLSFPKSLSGRRNGKSSIVNLNNSYFVIGAELSKDGKELVLLLRIGHIV